MSFKIHQKVSPEIVSLVFGVFILCFVLGFWALAWTEPTADPPLGNVDAPLNVGPTGQTKGGGLILNQDKNTYGLIIDGDAGNANGKVGIGVLSPDYKLDVAGDIRLGPQPATYRVKNVADPTADTDVATKGYVDSEVSSGYWVPTDVTKTSATHNGNFGGYDGIYDWIQNNGCAGYHVCSLSEVIAWAQAGNDPSAVHNAFFATDVTYTTGVPNCGSFTTWNDHCYVLKAPNSVSPLKVYVSWIQNGCSTARYVACCK